MHKICYQKCHSILKGKKAPKVAQFFLLILVVMVDTRNPSTGAKDFGKHCFATRVYACMPQQRFLVTVDTSPAGYRKFFHWSEGLWQTLFCLQSIHICLYAAATVSGAWQWFSQHWNNGFISLVGHWQMRTLLWNLLQCASGRSCSSCQHRRRHLWSAASSQAAVDSSPAASAAAGVITMTDKTQSSSCSVPLATASDCRHRLNNL